MCGFVGYVDKSDIKGHAIRKMNNLIAHRGPDDAQFFGDKNVKIGFRRLSMLDVAHGGQPIYSEDGSKVLTFNGEIYNYKDIRKQLKKLKYPFMTDVDSEVIMRGYEAWGTKIFKKLQGMFAIAIYDSEKKSKKHPKVILARDFIGVKPLYYYDDGKTFMWGSEIKAFLGNPDFKKELNTKLLPAQFSFDYIPTRETLFKHVYKVMPGQYLVHDIKTGQTKLHTYYDLNFNHINKNMKVPNAVKKIRQLVKKAVASHMISDPRVKVGAFLSSGVDSSYILKEASEHKPIHSFSLGYNDSKYSELKYSTAFAKHIHQKNTPIKMSANDFFKIIPTMMYYNDIPLSNAAEPQAYYLSHFTRKYVKATLSGESIDEYAMGYEQEQDPLHFVKYHKYIPKWLRKSSSKMATHLPRFHGRRYLIRGGEPIWESYFRVNYLFNNHDRNKLFKNTKIKNYDVGKKYAKPIFDKVKNLNIFNQERYFELKYWLPFDIFKQADAMSMANSLELRVPFADKRLADFFLTVPSKLCLRHGMNKYIWRKATDGILPKSVTNRPKLGFPSPLASWMRQPKFHKMIMKAFTSQIAHKFFNVKYLKKIVKQHDHGKSNMEKIFAVYCFIIWYSIYFPEYADLHYSKDIHYAKPDKEAL